MCARARVCIKQECKDVTASKFEAKCLYVAKDRCTTTVEKFHTDKYLITASIAGIWRLHDNST